MFGKLYYRIREVKYLSQWHIVFYIRKTGNCSRHGFRSKHRHFRSGLWKTGSSPLLFAKKEVDTAVILWYNRKKQAIERDD